MHNERQETMSSELQSIFSHKCKYKTIIWGTKAAGKICYRLLKEMNADIVAAGDNNTQNIGGKLYDIPILSLQEIQILYPDAFIVIGSFFHRIADSIIQHLRMASDRFTFCYFEQIEYLYEIKCLNRKIRNPEKLYQVINNVNQDENTPWKRMINKNVLSEYRYVVKDSKAEDLKKMLLDVYGVKKLVLIVDYDRIKETEELVGELSEAESIGHIVIAINYKSIVDINALETLSRKVFYVICDEAVPKKFLTDLERAGFIIDTKKIPDELFHYRSRLASTIVKEENIIKGVLSYVGIKGDKAGCQINLTSKPVYIVQLFNGLANQMLMYLFGRFIEEESDRIVVFDDTILNLDVIYEEENVRRIHDWNKTLTMEEVRTIVAETRSRNSFYKFKRAEIAEVFNISIRLLSEYFDDETWNMYLSKVKREFSNKYAQSFPLGQVLLENGTDIAVVKDSLMPEEFLAADNCCCIDTYIWGKPHEQGSVMNYLLHNNKNIYFIGVWATGKTEDWLFNNRKWVSDKFFFRLNLNKKNMQYVKEIEQADGIMIHIRRGDFARHKISASLEYFQRTIELAETMKEYKNRKYFIFSDDLEWCQKHEKELGVDKMKENISYVVGNTGANSYIDMYLMSLGKILIPTPGSSFSYIAMLISKTIEKFIDIPKYFYDLEHGMDIVPAIITVKR